MLTQIVRTKDRYLNIHDLQQRPDGLTVDIHGAWSALSFGGFQQWEPSPPYSPTTYDSPDNNGAGLPYFQPHVEQVRHNSHASFFGPTHTSRSPVSAGSSNVHLPQWGPNAHNATYASLNTSSGSEASYGDSLALHNCRLAVQPTYLGAYSTAVWTPEDRDFMEQDELIMSSNASRYSSTDLHFHENASSNEEKYLDMYWTWSHAFRPIIHRPSFDAHQTSPLLKAAMLALGAQACNDVSDKQNARQIHEKCMKVLQKVCRLPVDIREIDTDKVHSARSMSGTPIVPVICKLSSSSNYIRSTSLADRLSNYLRSSKMSTSR